MHDISYTHLSLTATGAWFTAKAQTQTQAGMSVSWQIGDFITLSADNGSANEFRATAYTLMDNNADGDLEDEGEKVPLAENGKLHPGDTIEFVDGQTISISASDCLHNFYYVILVDGNIWLGEDEQGVTGVANQARLFAVEGEKDLVLYEATVEHTLTDANSHVSGPVEGVYTVKTDTTKGAAGHTITLSCGATSVEIRAVQYNNYTAASAYTFLMGASGEAIND